MAALKHGIRNSETETEMEKEMETETETATETESVKEGSKQSICKKKYLSPLTTVGGITVNLIRKTELLSKMILFT